MVRNDWKNGGKKWRTRVGWGGGRFIKGTIFSAGPSHGHVVKMVFTAGPIVVGLSGSGRRWEWNSLCISYFYAQSKGARLFSFFGLFSWFSISIASSPICATKWIWHFLCDYPTMTLLHYMKTPYVMIWQEGRGHPYYRTPWLIWFCHMSIFYTLLYKICNFRIFFMLI